MHKRLLIVFILGFSSGLPFPLVTSTLQAWFSEAGMSVMATGMLSLIGLPYIYRVVWGPLLDRYSLFSLGKRRSWILSMQILLLIGFNLMAWFTPQVSLPLMSGLAFLLACLSATQDMAIEAHRTEYLPSSQQALGASFAVFGYRLALLLSGGLALVIAQNTSWEVAYRLMGLLMLIGVFATFYSPEPSIQAEQPQPLLHSFIAPIKELIQRPGIFSLVCFILLYKLGEAFTTTTSGIVMPFLIQGIGFSLETIGYVNKIMGVIAILLGGLMAGIVLLRYSIVNVLLVFGLLQAVANILFVALAMVGKNLTLFAIAAVVDNFAAGMGSTAMVALFMRIVDKRYTATQFSILAALSAVPRVFSGPLAAWLQANIGWVGLYKLSVILALAFIPFLYKMRKLIPSPIESSPFLARLRKAV
ncbi:AmpG protein (plasmid) [Legionella adelaidensis]|uniref:AmpG protein n=1 Tax=Legionella adelaidensis TaxID=45056 RepID=A0A0W0R568_9GAMM|nr:MFS transporter [Legionella adelaidensis]KTC66239.1 AmpG protein [Legionella adelaidensis]VEH85754.1 AmpG protein [Legionella adelaidensis]